MDWLPTIAALTGLTVAPATKATLRGIDLSPILLQKATLSNYTLRPASHPLLNEWRFQVAGPCVNGAPRLAIRDNDLKLMINPPGQETRVELYHLPPVTDASLLTSPPEFQNLASDPKYAEDVHRLSELLLAWYKTLPAGPHNPARGCAGYRFPGSAPAPDEMVAEEDSDEAAWWG